MSLQEPVVIKTSPIVFIKRLIVIEFTVALITTVVSLWVDLTAVYNTSALARYTSFSIIVAIVVTIFQVLIIAIAFITWYVESYEIRKDRIIRRRGNLFGTNEVAKTAAIADIQINQSQLGDTFNYGTLKLILLGSRRHGLLKNIPNPSHFAELIQQSIEPQQADANHLLQQSIPDLIDIGEGQYLEFKSSLTWDYRRKRINKDLNKAVMKNLVAFMNTTGGALLMGVDDDGQILGLEIEIQTLGKPNVDGFENNFNMAFNKMIGVEYRQYISLDFSEIEKKTICRVLALPAPEPVFLRQGAHEEFYIRTGNSSQPLAISKAVKYILNHFDR